jgi:hypothetical protein
LSESATAKTKRKLSALILNYQWQYQYSIFYDEIPDCQNLAIDDEKLKNRLSRNYPDIPFLILRRTIKQEWKGLEAYVTIFSVKNIKDMASLVDRSFSSEITFKKRKLWQKKIEDTASAIRNQRPHDLDGFFGRKTRRYSVM